MYEDILKNDIVHMDETTLTVIKSLNDTCYMWGLISSKYAKPIKLYFYKDNRRHENASELFKDFKGYVISDGCSDFIVKWKKGNQSTIYIYRGNVNYTFSSCISKTLNSNFYLG